MNLFPPSSGLIKVICSHQFSHRPGNIPPIPKWHTPICSHQFSHRPANIPPIPKWHTPIPRIFQAVFFAMFVPLSWTIRCHILEDNNLNAHPYSGLLQGFDALSFCECFLVFQRIIVPSSSRTLTARRFFLKCLKALWFFFVFCWLCNCIYVVNETYLVHNLFLVYFVNFIYNLYTFWTSADPSSGGTTVLMRHLVLIILYS